MPDSLVYDLAADLTDFIAAAVGDIDLPDGCTIPERIFTSAGEPDVWVCGELAVWATAWGSSDVPNRDQGIDQTTCASGTYIEIHWRVAECISTSPDGKSPISVTDHETDAACIYTLAWGIYRRIMVDLESIFTGISDCKKITGGQFEVGQRSGGMISGGQSFRISVDLTAPTLAS